jgi:hypothetical protein
MERWLVGSSIYDGLCMNERVYGCRVVGRKYSTLACTETRGAAR